MAESNGVSKILYGTIATLVTIVFAMSGAWAMDINYRVAELEKTKLAIVRMEEKLDHATVQLDKLVASHIRDDRPADK